MESTPSLSPTLLHWMERERLAPPRLARAGGPDSVAGCGGPGGSGPAGAASGDGPLEDAGPAAWSLRMWQPGDPVGVPGALLAGDALGADPLVGEGIRYALWSGRLAGEAAARAAARGAAPAPGAYRRRLRLSRSGIALSLLSRLGPRLHGGERQWRRMAADSEVASAVAAVVSGAHPLGPVTRLLLRYRALRRAPP